MKKVFALLFSLSAMTAVFAQNGRGRNESRDVILGQQNKRTVYEDRREDGYYSQRERDDQIERINRQYDRKIESIRKDRYLRNNEKKREIRALENERKDRIREVWQRFNDRNYRNDRNEKRY